MIRRSFRIGLTLGILGGLAFALAKMLGARPQPAATPTPVPAEPWPKLQETPPAPAAVPPTAAPAPAPTPARREPLRAAIDGDGAEGPAASVTKTATAKKATTAKKAAKKADAAPAASWVEPSGDVCPTSHPVKAKLSSKIFHLPGMLNYERTKPDRCYLDPDTAAADGLRAAKR